MLQKNKSLKIQPGKCFDDMYDITISNVGLYPDAMKKTIQIIKHLSNSNEYFFGFHRTDDFYLTAEESQWCEEKIPEFFIKHGRYEPFTTVIGKKTFEGYLTVASAPVNDETFEILPFILHHFLETTFFCPKVEWSVFSSNYRTYMKHGCCDYITDEFTDFQFIYADSGDFSVKFNPNTHNPSDIEKTINDIMYPEDALLNEFQRTSFYDY